MSSDEVRHYREFRDTYVRSEVIGRNSFLKKAKTLIDRSELVRDEGLALAFRPLNNHWSGKAPFEYWSYDEYMKSTGKMLEEHFPFKEAKKMLFNPLETGGRFNGFIIDILAAVLTKQFLNYA